MRPGDLAVYDRHNHLTQVIHQFGAWALATDLDGALNTVTRIRLTGVYIGPDGTRFPVPANICDEHETIIRAAIALRDTYRKLVDTARSTSTLDISEEPGTHD